jgi:hypothetical protein
MKTNKLLAALSLPLLFSGCVSPTGPMFQNQQGPSAVRLYGESPGFMGMWRGGASVSFVEVDGRQVQRSFLGGYPMEVFVVPGAHSFTLGLHGDSYVEGQGTVGLRVLPSHTYKFTARRVGLDFDVSMWDVTNGDQNQNVWAQFRIHGQQGRAPVVVPIFVR